MNQQILDHMAKYAGVLSNPKRLEILALLGKRGEMTAGDIAKTVDVTMPNLSQHLGIMKQYGLVASRKVGLNMIYGLNGSQTEGTLHPLAVLGAIKAAVIHQLEQQRDLLAAVAGA